MAVYRRLRHRASILLSVDAGGRTSRIVDIVIMALIALNVIAVSLATVDRLYAAYESIFIVIEVVSVAVFTVEYVARVWSAVEFPAFDRPIVGRLRFAAQPMLVIDLLAILPFFLGAFLVDLRFLRALRLFRFFRLLKMARYSESMQRFGDVIQRKREDLLIALSATTILLIVASSMMYFAEHGAQPDIFSSIPASLWWGVVTLTTVGYGDVYPVTPVGKLLGAVIAVLGVGLVALPASILASGFIEEASEQDRERCPHCGEELD